jgi:hypothetical protein
VNGEGEGIWDSGSISWDDLAETLAQVEAEFEAQPQPAISGDGPDASGIPLWAYRVWTEEVFPAWQEAAEKVGIGSESNPNGTRSVEEVLERFEHGFVETLRAAGAEISFEGTQAQLAGDTDGELTIKIRGDKAHMVTNALGEAADNAGQMLQNPMMIMVHYMLRGINPPSMEEIEESKWLCRSLANCIALVCSGKLEGLTEIKAT